LHGGGGAGSAASTTMGVVMETWYASTTPRIHQPTNISSAASTATASANSHSRVGRIGVTLLARAAPGRPPQLASSLSTSLVPQPQTRIQHRLDASPHWLQPVPPQHVLVPVGQKRRVVDAVVGPPGALPALQPCPAATQAVEQTVQLAVLPGRSEHRHPIPMVLRQIRPRVQKLPQPLPVLCGRRFRPVFLGRRRLTGDQFRQPSHLHSPPAPASSRPRCSSPHRLRRRRLPSAPARTAEAASAARPGA